MWNDLTMSERAGVIKMAVKAGLRDMKSIRDFYDNSLKYAEGGPKVTYGKPYYSYDKNMQIETDNGKPILNYSATLPEVNIIPDSKKSPADRNADERFRRKTFSDYAEHKDRDYTQRQIMKSQRDWNNSLEKKALGYAQDAMTGIGIGADIVSGLPIYSSLKGSRILSEADSLPEYIEGGLWLAPIGGVMGKEAWNISKNVSRKFANKFADEYTMWKLPKSEENVVASVISDDLKYSKEDMENIFRKYKNYDPSTNTFKTLEELVERSATKNKDKDARTITKYITDPDKRFMMFEPGKYINYDIGNMSIDEVVSTFGPETEKYKKLYDIAKAHNFEGKYAEIGKDAEYNILNRFAINKADPDVAKGIAEARGIYSIPEYRARFNRFGTLGDTFIEDALARIDNMKIQGLSKNLSIKGQHGVNGGAYTLPDATGIGIKNADKSSYIIDVVRHETNHVGHGLRNQPAFMKYHNEKIRPIVKEGKPTDTPLAKYYDEMDEIVERSKTAVEYANKIRKEGESLNQVLERLANVDIYDSEVPSDIRQMVSRYTKDSLIKFWENFIGATAIPITIGTSLSNKKAEGGSIHIAPSKRGTFTAAATKHGMGVQEFASKILANKDNYSSAMIKKANFAKNASKWKHGLGGYLFEEGGPKSTNREYKSANSWSPSNLHKILTPASTALMNFGKYGKFTDIWKGGTPEETYFLPKKIQRQEFLSRGYTEAPNDYGLVKKAVNNRDMPVYQTKADDISREKVVPIGNINDRWFGKEEAKLEHPGHYPTAVYYSPYTNEYYQKGWDLNDYGGGSGAYNNYDALGKIRADIADAAGSPVVTTTGISRIGSLTNMMKEEDTKDIAIDFLNSKGLVPMWLPTKELPILNVEGKPFYDLEGKPFTYTVNEFVPSLPEITITGKRRKKVK